MVHKLTPLCELAAKHGTDKGGWHLKAGDTCHNYTPTYYKLFKNRREQVKNVLEIGVSHGCSLRMWEEFFPNAQIIGFDNNKSCLFNDGRIRTYLADQASADSLWMAINAIGIDKYDLIVDDGSHEIAHQIATANALYPCLADEDSCHVIEDIHYDCKPELLVEVITQGHWDIHSTGIGLGRARCECGCGAGEVLLVGYQ